MLQIEPPLPGYCQCGCGRETPISDRNIASRGIIKGQHTPYVLGHSHKGKGGPKHGPDEKYCGGCGKVKKHAEFYKNRSNWDGVGPRCKPCMAVEQAKWRDKNREKVNANQRKRRLLKDYNLPVEEYDRLLEAQGDKCAICEATETRTRAGNTHLLSVDHCHETGKVRGLLCNNCNRALGLFNDNPEMLRRAVAYLSG